MLNKAFNIYRTLNVLSIDVAIGAMCSALFLGNIFQVSISYTSVLVLGLSVWIIYTADHLLDVTRLIRAGLHCNTLRHQFHQNHFKELRLVWVIVCVLILALLIFIPQQVIIAGVGLMIVVALYLLLSSYLGYGKEFIIAVGYVGGVMLPMEITTVGLLNNSVILICFFITVLFNVLMFSYFDVESDSVENKLSLVRVMGLKRIHLLFIMLLVVQFVLSIVIFSTTSQALPALVLLIMTTVMSAVLYFNEAISTTRARVIGEAVFILPGFYWLFTN
jgi:hypothetical protein